MPIVGNITVSNPGGAPRAVIDQLTAIAHDALSRWGDVLAGSATANVTIVITDDVPSGRADGGWQSGIGLGQLNGYNLRDGPVAVELRTGGEHSGAVDMIVRIHTDYLLNEMYLDPTPDTTADIPFNQTDALSVLMHEFGHALGFIGYWNATTGSFTANTNTPFDARMVFDGDDTYFDGPNVQAVFGGMVPLISASSSHYGDTPAPPGTSPLNGLMNGTAYYRGVRYTISDLDLAIMADLGLGTIRDDIFDQTWFTDLNGGAGVDLYIRDFTGEAGPVSFDAQAGGVLTVGGVRLHNIERFEFIFGSGSDTAAGGDHADTFRAGDGQDVLNGRGGNDILDGGANIDRAVFSGVFADYVLTTSGFVLTVTGADGTDTLTNIEFLEFDDQTFHWRPGTGQEIDFGDDPDSFMSQIRDFDGNDLGAPDSWTLIGSTDIQGDGDLEYLFFNRDNGRWATVGPAEDGLVYFDDHGWAGDTRVVGIYIDPLVASGEVVQGSDHDSQRRFQNDINIGNIAGILGADDYDGDGLQEVYFSLTDGTAYLHAYMHADGNIRYANYQNQQQVIDFLTDNGWSSDTWDGWFPEAAGLVVAQDDFVTA